MDEAGDMLTVSPNLQDTVEEAHVQKISETLKRKEWERSEKWRKMARVVKQGSEGHGMDFEFDVKNPKLVERTWKGIPDRWRGAAWWSFLATAAQEHNAPSAEFIINSFHNLQERSSPDDVQIDLDVPRTISRHIMFRRRYRGGQRLLFRVLHALSIYFPETGYVQGMASLAATLLCYFDEEKCFVMLVRMWSLRGLDKLYRPGFEGLMSALREFDETWVPKAVGEKLVSFPPRWANFHPTETVSANLFLFVDGVEYRLYSIRNQVVPDAIQFVNSLWRSTASVGYISSTGPRRRRGPAKHGSQVDIKSANKCKYRVVTILNRVGYPARHKRSIDAGTQRGALGLGL
jgi:hypothetical protein